MLARLAALLDEAVVARVGRQRRCRLGLKGGRFGWLVVWVRPEALCGFPAWPSVWG